MIKVSKKTEYALMALQHLASLERESRVSAREICEKFTIPFDTTAKVMQALCNANILDSSQGIKGGYKLNIDLKEVSFLKIVQITDGKSNTHFCETSKGLCDLYETCNISSPLQELNSHVNNYLETLSLSELFIHKSKTQTVAPTL